MVFPSGISMRRFAHDSARGSFSRPCQRCHRSSLGVSLLSACNSSSCSRAICRPMARALIRMRGSMGGYRRATVVIRGLQKRASRLGLGAKGRALVCNHDCRLVVLCATLATARALQRPSPACLLAGCAGIIEPETRSAKNSDHFAKPKAQVPGRHRTLRRGFHQMQSVE